MLQNSKAFGSFSTNDMDKARKFYDETLGLKVKDNAMGILEVYFPGDSYIIIYPKPDHQPAVFTVLSFPVKDIDETVDALIAKDITMEKYDDFNQDEKGIARSGEGQPGPSIAWFKDPAGNILSVFEDNF